MTANLDGQTEAAVLAALEQAAAHRTVLSISHRLYQGLGGRQIPSGGTAGEKAQKNAGSHGSRPVPLGGNKKPLGLRRHRTR